MWSAVGNLASIVTIFGFVITIWQLFALKKSVKNLNKLYESSGVMSRK